MYIPVNGLGCGMGCGLGYVAADGSTRYGPAPDPGVPIPDQTENQIGYLWDAVFGEHPSESIGPVASAPSSQWIAGIPNWVTGVVGAAFGLVLVKGMK